MVVLVGGEGGQLTGDGTLWNGRIGWIGLRQDGEEDGCGYTGLPHILPHVIIIILIQTQCSRCMLQEEIQQSNLVVFQFW